MGRMMVVIAFHQDAPDVRADGSVLLFYVGGHTLGSQVCLVHLKNTGYVLLSGDAVHLRSNFGYPAYSTHRRGQ
jgi:glyoxylase-like metal-dependent hydrolase (beta-lactamase superfamily II)